MLSILFNGFSIFIFLFFTFLLTGLSQALSFTEPEARQLVGMTDHQLVPPPQPWDCRGNTTLCFSHVY